MINTSVSESLVELIIPNKPEFLRVVRLVVSGYLSRLPIPIDAVENIKVAVSEACNNAIQYAYGENEEGKLHIRCLNDADRLVFEVEDTGKGLDAQGADADSLDMDDDKGFGFLLINTLMDQVQVRSAPERGTIVTMTKMLKK